MTTHAAGPSAPTPSQLETVVDLATTEASLTGVWKRFLSDGAVRADLTDAVLLRILSAIQRPETDPIPLAQARSNDEYTFAHALNVGVLSAAVAREAGFGPCDIEDLAIAAFFHDIGQCAVPEAILTKPGRLQDHERARIAVHPAFGAGILQQQAALPPLASIVAYEHHIRGDGLGYPHHRRPWRTHLASQIVQLTDIYDALRTDRPFRPARTRDEALSAIGSIAGAAFDRELFHTFRDRVAPRLVRADEARAAGDHGPASSSASHAA